MNRIPGCFLLLDFSTFQRIAEFEIGENQGNCIQVETVARLSITLTENISMGFLTTEECSPFFLGREVAAHNLTSTRHFWPG